MCGIVGYIGDKNASDIILKGLKRLEYRGYDSAGIAMLNGSVEIEKGSGKIANLSKLLKEHPLNGNIGIGHTRWATHGLPNDINAHPHCSESGDLALVHHGIIENYATLKKELADKRRHFYSETDSEVIAQLIEEIYQKNPDVSFERAVQLALKQVV